ncbi:uncharacterized protein LOC142239621 [Haematobia irritans]|uniref:uncharacterized protein LOC142239621 n=1 Tax=Haematobia irritans TaxID=7368 RepID=UPI003F4F793D
MANTGKNTKFLEIIVPEKEPPSPPNHPLIMKFFIVALAFVACAYADVSELGYNYDQPAPPAPAPAPTQPERSYIPPAAPAPAPAPVAPAPAPVAPAPAPVAPVNTYVPPAPVAPAPAPAPVAPKVEEPTNSYIPPAPVAPTEEIEETAADGYRYKAVRRVVYRHRA